MNKASQVQDSLKEDFERNEDKIKKILNSFEQDILNKKKKSKNSYMVFLSKNREEIKAKLQEESDGKQILITDIAKKAGEIWRKMDKQEKLKYAQLSNNLKKKKKNKN